VLLKNAAWFLILWSSSFMCLNILSWTLVNLFNRLESGSLVLTEASNILLADYSILVRVNDEIAEIVDLYTVTPEILRGKFFWHCVIKITIGGCIYYFIGNNLFLVVKEFPIPDRARAIANI